MNSVEIKKDKKNIYRIFLILCVFNIPIIIFSMVNGFSTFKIVFTGLFMVFYELFLSFVIDRVIFLNNFKIMDNAKRIESSKYGKKFRRVFYIFMLILYMVFLYFFLFDGEENNNFIMVYVTISSFFNIFNSEGNFSLYIGDNYLLYGEKLIQKNKIIDYDIKIRKKGKKGKKDKISIIVHIMNSSDLEVYGGNIAHYLKEVLDEIQEEKYVREKMKEYGVEE